MNPQQEPMNLPRLVVQRQAELNVVNTEYDHTCPQCGRNNEKVRQYFYACG